MFQVVFGILTFQFLYFKILKLKLYYFCFDFFFLALGVISLLILFESINVESCIKCVFERKKI